MDDKTISTMFQFLQPVIYGVIGFFLLRTYNNRDKHEEDSNKTQREIEKKMIKYDITLEDMKELKDSVKRTDKAVDEMKMNIQSMVDLLFEIKDMKKSIVIIDGKADAAFKRIDEIKRDMQELRERDQSLTTNIQKHIFQIKEISDYAKKSGWDIKY